MRNRGAKKSGTNVQLETPSARSIGSDRPGCSPTGMVLCLGSSLTSDVAGMEGKYIEMSEDREVGRWLTGSGVAGSAKATDRPWSLLL